MFLVFRHHTGSQQTVIGELLRALRSSATSHSMLFWGTNADPVGPSLVVKRHLHAFHRTVSPSTVHLTSRKSLCLFNMLCVLKQTSLVQVCWNKRERCWHDIAIPIDAIQMTFGVPCRQVEQCLVCPSGKPMPCRCGSTLA